MPHGERNTMAMRISFGVYYWTILILKVHLTEIIIMSIISDGSIKSL
jgi:hypothetical protein